MAIYRWSCDLSPKKSDPSRTPRKKQHPFVSYRVISTHGLACRLEYTSTNGFRYLSDAPTPYDADTAAYAVCRYLRHTPAVLDELIFLAVKLGLQTGKSKPVTRTVRTSAASLQIPGRQAVIKIVVSQGTITVKSVIVTE